MSRFTQKFVCFVGVFEIPVKALSRAKAIKKEPIILPEKYYLTYFHYLLDFVEQHYDHVLDQPEYQFYQSFRDLSEDAQCLYLRFSNRRGDFFRLSKIHYQEIKDVDAAKQELQLHGFIQINASHDLLQLHLFTRSELLTLFPFLRRDQRKFEMMEELTEEDVHQLHEKEEIAEVLKNQEVDFIKLLFFGDRYGQMTDFVIRDVGNVKIETLDESKFSPWFQSREEALGVMHISQLAKMVKELMLTDLPLANYLQEMPWTEWLRYPRSAKAAQKLLLKVAYHLERSGQPEAALDFYDLTDKHPARERKVRLLDQLGETDKALGICQEILTHPENASEQTFAVDFLNRSGVRINRSMTHHLKAASSVTIAHPTYWNSRVEQAVISHFEGEGWQGIHGENFLWRGVFGLVFWEHLFDESYGSFHHPLQRQPSDLNDETFFTLRGQKLQQDLSALRTKRQLLNKIRSNYENKEGVANRFVTWHESLIPTLEVMIAKVPLKGLKLVLLEIAKNTKENSTGFPDLFLWRDEDYRFYEVKSPNDHLSAQQLFWINFLKGQKIKAEILRVNYQENQ